VIRIRRENEENENEFSFTIIIIIINIMYYCNKLWRLLDDDVNNFFRDLLKEKDRNKGYYYYFNLSFITHFLVKDAVFPSNTNIISSSITNSDDQQRKEGNNKNNYGLHFYFFFFVMFNFCLKFFLLIQPAFIPSIWNCGKFQSSRKVVNISMF
jgi:hypothetical protein